MSNYSSSIEKLTCEIIESQKIRSDFMKWKLVVVSSLGAVGIGLKENCTLAPLLLLIVPFVCIYVDALCYHVSLRITSIGHFLELLYKKPELVDPDGINPILTYEKYLSNAGNSFRWEYIDSLGSSILASLIVAAFPFIIKHLDIACSIPFTGSANGCCCTSVVFWYFLSGVFGSILCLISFVYYRLKGVRIKNLKLP